MTKELNNIENFFNWAIKNGYKGVEVPIKHIKMFDEYLESQLQQNKVEERECEICNEKYTKEELQVGHCFNCGEKI